MKAAETILHLRHTLPSKMKNMIPNHVWEIASRYNLKPLTGERLDKSENE